MAQLCPSCNKFAGLELQDPEVNSVEFDAENKSVAVDVRIVRNSSCCGDEMKEYTFNTDAELPAEIAKKMDELALANPDGSSDDFEAEEDGCDQLEEGGGRYAKSYYGYTLNVKVTHKGDEIGKFEVTDKVAASGMDELT
jgi:hypothetical protein